VVNEPAFNALLKFFRLQKNIKQGLASMTFPSNY